MNRGFSERTLALVKRTKRAFLTDLAIVETEALTTNDYGGSLHSWQEVASSVPCRVLVETGGTNAAKMIGEQEGISETYMIAIALGFFTPAVNQRITVNGQVFQVVNIQEHLTDRDEIQLIVKKDVR